MGQMIPVCEDLLPPCEHGRSWRFPVAKKQRQSLLVATALLGDEAFVLNAHDRLAIG